MSETVSEFPWWLEVIRSLGLPILGGIAAYIAFVQYKLAAAKRADDLFDRRYSLLQEATAISREQSIVDPDYEQLTVRLRSLQAKATILFNPSFAEQLHHAAIEDDAEWIGDINEFELDQLSREREITELFKSEMSHSPSSGIAS